KPPSIHVTAQDGLTCEIGDGCEFNIFVERVSSHPLSGGNYTTHPAGTLTVIVNGREKKTYAISEDSPDSFNELLDFEEYIDDEGDYTFQIKVVDSVLYSSTSNSIHVTFTD